MMKVKSNKKVNIRAFEPYQRSNNLKGELNAGFEIEVEEVEGQYIEEGEGLDKIASTKWYKDKNGDYYWSGGFEIVSEITYQKKFDVKINYNEEFQQIPINYRRTLGEGIKVAILDSGINSKHIAFKDKTITSFNATDDSNGCEDTVGHGSHISGLISAQNGEYLGIAPNVTLCISKIINKNEIVYPEVVIRAIEWAIEQKVDIINMSFSFHKRHKDEIAGIIKKAYDADIVLVSSAGENQYIARQEDFLYPSFFSECISVGAVSNKFLIDYAPIQFNSRLNLLMNYTDYISCGLGLNNYLKMKGASMSSAIVTGIICLLLSGKNNNASRNTYCRELLKQIGIDFNDTNNVLNNFQLIRLS